MADIESRASRRATQIEFYDTTTLVLHWLTALLVLVLFCSETVVFWFAPRNRYLHFTMESWHVSLGILFAVLMLARIVWRLTGARRLPAESGLPGLLSQAMYGALYVLLAAEAICGFVLRWAQGERFSFFGLFSIPDPMTQDRALAHMLEEWHNYIGWTIVILALGHAAAALVHHYVLKDRVMGRMLFRKRAA